MNDRLIPSAEARARVQKRSQKELQAFFDEIPALAMRPLAPFLPPVHGFRRGSPAGIVKQKEALARRLSRPTANEQDYNALYSVWRTWIDETQPNAPLIQGLIDEIEEAADKADGPKARGLAIEQHTDSLLQKLKEESEQNRSTREDIDRLYTFSPLPETTAARGIIATAKLAADVARDVTYRNLPTRLDQDERELQSIKAELGRVATVADECAKAIHDIPDLRDAIREPRSSANAARAAVNEQVNKPTHYLVESGRAAVEARIKALSDDVRALGESVGELASNLGRLEQVVEAVGKLANTQAKSDDEQKQHGNRIDQVAETLEQARRDIDALLEDRTQADRIAPLAEQIAELARRVEPLLSHRTKDFAQHIASISDALDWATLPIGRNVAAIASHAGLAFAFADALLPLGIRKSGVQLLAEECAAAVAARQVIFLQGAFAPAAARALAAATGGATSARLAIPIGMQNGRQLRLVIEEAFSSLNDRVGGLAVEGINHVPFDLIQGIIADCVGAAAPPNVPRIAVFATLSRGVASLPTEPEALELGPVFDLDYFDWRTNPAPASTPQASFLPAKTDRAIFAQLAGTSANAEEAVHLAQALAPKRNPAVERTVVCAYQALHLTRSDQRTVTPLHSLFYGWLLPYWRALGLSREQVDSEFDGGKVLGAPLEGRLTAMFAAEFPNTNKGGEP